MTYSGVYVLARLLSALIADDKRQQIQRPLANQPIKPANVVQTRSQRGRFEFSSYASSSIDERLYHGSYK
jgi:hypothetical protein